MGRPQENNKRDRQLNVSLTAQEFERLQRRARTAGMRLVDYGRWLLLRGAAAPAPQHPQASVEDRLTYQQLRRLGNNLNQIARRLHAFNESAPPSLEPLLHSIRTILARRGSHDS